MELGTEQSLSESQIYKCTRLAFPDSKYIITINTIPRIGTINDIYEIFVGGVRYCIRVRVRNELFRYCGCFQEPIVGYFFNCMEECQTQNPITAYMHARNYVLSHNSGKSIGGSVSPLVIFYDMSRNNIANDWQCLKWVDGDLLDKHENPARYYSLGKALANLHRFKFNVDKNTCSDAHESPHF